MEAGVQPVDESQGSSPVRSLQAAPRPKPLSSTRRRPVATLSRKAATSTPSPVILSNAEGHLVYSQ